MPNPSKNELVNLRRELARANIKLGALTSLREQAPPKIVRVEKTSRLREMTAVVLASDWHVEERVTREASLGRNTYSLAEADRRIARFFDAIIWAVEHHRASKKIKIHDLVLALLGDFMTGYIHEEGLEANALSPIETLLWLQPRLEAGIARLLALDLRSIVIPCSYGNHGRTTPNRRIATGAANSYEWLLYNAMKTRNVEKSVRYAVTPAAHQFVDAYSFRLHFTHGDEVALGLGPAPPIAALMRRVAAWDSVFKADYHHMGHHHRQQDLGRVVINGSLIGFNAYAMSVGAGFEKPKQTFYLLDSREGKCAMLPLWVS